MRKLKITIILVLFGITVQPDFCLVDIRSIQLKEILSIGTLNDDSIFFVTSVVADDEGYIYLTDSLDCSLKKFDCKGMLIKKTGRKGQGPGEFQFPVLVRYCNDTIYVIDQNRNGIQAFDNDLSFKHQLPFSHPIFDFEVLDDGRIFVLSHVPGEFPPILQINKNRSKNFDSNWKALGEDFWRSNGKFEIDEYGNIYFVSSFEDNIAKFDKDRHLMWKKTLLGGKKAREKRPDEGIPKIPIEMIYKDIALDKFGHLFILGGHVAEHRSQDIYVLNNEGNHLTTIILPEPSHFLYIDNKNFLYSRATEGISLKKYLIEYIEN